MRVYCYERCSTCKKALKWLEEKNIHAEVIDIKGDHPDEAVLRAAHQLSGQPLKKFFNTSGLKYKELNLKDRIPQMTEEEIFDLLSTDGMLVKRPILISGDKVLVGFKEEEWELLK